MPFAPPNLLNLLGGGGSNPTLSAMLLKINKLRNKMDSLLENSFAFVMSDMQFSRARLRSVKAKTD